MSSTMPRSLCKKLHRRPLSPSLHASRGRFGALTDARHSVRLRRRSNATTFRQDGGSFGHDLDHHSSGSAPVPSFASSSSLIRASMSSRGSRCLLSR